MADSGKSKKHGRNASACRAYRSSGRRERNKARRIAAHLKSAPWDDCARAAYDALPVSARKLFSAPPSAPSPAEVRRANGVTLTQMMR